MAPKNKFMKEEIICAALDVVRAGGIGALTAKAIADRLGVSTRPIFSYYKTMDEVKADVREAASELYKKYSEDPLPNISYKARMCGRRLPSFIRNIRKRVFGRQSRFTASECSTSDLRRMSRSFTG